MGKVKWSPESREDLEEIYLQYCKFSEKFAQKWADDVFEASYLLENNPRLGRIVPEVYIPSIREMIVGKYRLIYQVNSDDTIEVLTIRHTSKPLNQ